MVSLAKKEGIADEIIGKILEKDKYASSFKSMPEQFLAGIVFCVLSTIIALFINNIGV